MSHMEDVRASIEHDVLKVYPFGSRVYGVNDADSDIDLIIVVDSEDGNLFYTVKYPKMDIIVYSEKYFIQRIKDHEIDAIECISQDKYDSYASDFQLDRAKLRRKVSAIASNSYVKCKKKIAQGDIRIGKKSLFHSLRILGFGIQIAENGKIVNSREMNAVNAKVFTMGNDWDELNAAFKSHFNSLKTEFKKIAPLED